MRALLHKSAGAMLYKFRPRYAPDFSSAWRERLASHRGSGTVVAGAGRPAPGPQPRSGEGSSTTSPEAASSEVNEPRLAARGHHRPTRCGRLAERKVKMLHAALAGKQLDDNLPPKEEGVRPRADHPLPRYRGGPAGRRAEGTPRGRSSGRAAPELPARPDRPREAEGAGAAGAARPRVPGRGRPAQRGDQVPQAERGRRDRLIGWDRGWLLGWRDIARTSDISTSVPSVLPTTAMGTSFLSRSPPNPVTDLYFTRCGPRWR